MKNFDLSSYSLLEPLPVGGMTHAYVASRNGVERVVVKRLHHSYASKPEVRARWLERVALASQFSHPAGMRVVDYGSADDEAYMVVEFIEGVSLMNVVRGLRPTQERLSTGACVHIARTFLEVLAMAHSQRPPVLHHDVSTRSVRIAAEGSVRIAELGTWGIFSPREAIHERFERATAVYLSPEQVNGLEADARSELFSVGVMLYELLARERPFQGANQLAVALAIGSGKHKKLGEVAPAAPHALCEVVERLLASKPDDRFTSASEALSALAAFPVEDVRGELAALVPRFQANEKLQPARPKPSASAQPTPAGRADEPRTILGWAVPGVKPAPSPAAAPSPAPAPQGEPRTQLLHGPSMLGTMPRADAREMAASDEPRTRLQIPTMKAPSAPAVPREPRAAEPRTRVQGSFELPFRGTPAPSQTPPSGPSGPVPRTPVPVFGGAASEPPPAAAPTSPPAGAPQAPVPHPAVAVPPLMPMPAAPAPTPPPELRAEPAPHVAPPPVVSTPASVMPSSMAPTPPPLLSQPTSASSLAAMPPEPALLAMPSLVKSAPPAPAPPALSTPPSDVPMVSDGKTAFLDRNVLRQGAAASLPSAAPANPPPAAPALVTPPREVALAPAQDRGLPEFVPAMQASAPLGASLPDRGWKDPSHTLFKQKPYAKDPTRRERARVPTAVLVALCVVFGFALVTAGYFLIRLFS